MILQEVQETIEKYHMLDETDLVIVGLSGGADSVVLLDILVSLSKQRHFMVEAVHINHQLRAKADLETGYCESLCETYGIPCHVYRVDAAQYAKEHKCSLEEAGRFIRYQRYNQFAAKGTKVALGHHMNDRVETVLFNLMRGTGLTGLTGIAPVRDHYIRPLINISKDQIYTYAKAVGLDYYEDESNQEVIFTRNHIRHELIRFMEVHYNPQVAASIHQTALSLEEDEYCLSNLAREAFELVRTDQGIRISKLNLKPIAIRKRIYRLALAEVMDAFKDISYVHYEAIEKLLEGQSGKVLDLPHKVRVERAFDELLFYLAKENLEAGDIKTLFQSIQDLEGRVKSVDIPEGSYEMAMIAYEDMDPSENVLYLDAEALEASVISRYRENGDSIYLKQLGGHKKLKKYLMEQKIPATIRNRMPIISCGNQVLWVVGHLKSSLYEVDENTNHILEIRWKKY